MTFKPNLFKAVSLKSRVLNENFSKQYTRGCALYKFLRACLHGGRVPRLTELPGQPSYPGRANFSYVSLENASKRLHARQGNPPCRGTLSTCPRHPSRRAIFCHVNGSSRLAEVRRGARTALYFKAAFNVNCLW